MKKILILLLLLTSCVTKHHVIIEDGVNWYTTEEQEGIPEWFNYKGFTYVLDKR